ncbi:hypothetical protein [Moorena sp. SIOASIH]|uniref:hypothetical protein n=1 Tax=Moorena sp. SIOASIH TaxID=2607817 RepID=UPI0025ECB8ED|nr:hypothetical protein [Moorena sp. SIOASIH]
MWEVWGGGAGIWGAKIYCTILSLPRHYAIFTNLELLRQCICWKVLGDINLDIATVVGKLYNWANRCCCWIWRYLIWLDSDSPSAAWIVTDTTVKDIASENRLLSLYHVGIITFTNNLRHLPISPSPHLPTLPLIMGIQADLILELEVA